MNTIEPLTAGDAIVVTYGDGTRVAGTVLRVDGTVVVVDFGARNPGRIPLGPDGSLPPHAEAEAS